MRKMMFAAFLLGTTALYPAQAQAMPLISSFIGGLLTSLGATSLGGAIVGAGGFSAAGFAAGAGFSSTLLGGALIKTALSLGLSYLASLLRPRPNVPDPGAKLVNIRQGVQFMEFAYGKVRKGGPVNFWKAKSGKRYYDIILAAHEIDGISGLFADEREVTLNGSGFVQESDFNVGHSRLQIAEYLGAPGQVAPPLLTANFTQWTSAHDMEGLAHIVAVAENAPSADFSKPYPTGREPVISALLRGKKVYDPRDVDQDPDDDTTWVYSENAALIIADWATAPDGLGKTVNWSKIAIEADAADVDVLDRDGNTIKKWRLGGSYSAAEDRETTRAQMAVACDAFFYEDANGVVGFNVGRFIAPTVTIIDDDILRITYSEGQSGTDIVNAYSLQYTEPEQGYREAASAPYVIDDPTEPYSEDSLQVFWTDTHNQAVRVAKRLLLASRAKYRITATLKYYGINLIGQRFFTLDHVEAGVDMTFEIDRLTRNEDGITWTVEAHSVEETDFDFDAATEEPEKPKRTAFETTSDVPEPTGITAVSMPVTSVVAIHVDWDDPPRDSLLNQVRYRVHDPAGEWTQLSVPPGQSFLDIVGLLSGETYDVQVRSITPVGQASKWSPHSGDDEDSPTLTVAPYLADVLYWDDDTPIAWDDGLILEWDV